MRTALELFHQKNVSQKHFLCSRALFCHRSNDLSFIQSQAHSLWWLLRKSFFVFGYIHFYFHIVLFFYLFAVWSRWSMRCTHDAVHKQDRARGGRHWRNAFHTQNTRDTKYYHRKCSGVERICEWVVGPTSAEYRTDRTANKAPGRWWWRRWRAKCRVDIMKKTLWPASVHFYCIF